METDIRYNKALEMLEGYFTAFHKVGSDAYKPGLERSQALDAALGYPSRKFASVHVAGTNGKAARHALWLPCLPAQAIGQGCTHRPIWWISANASV